nr:SDR family NAD(P)-dependent oxidoreductase [Metabacillus arenae]
MGIGEATTKKLAEEGAKIVIAARREDRLKALVDSLPNADGYTSLLPSCICLYCFISSCCFC